jgi:type IV pilus assembly protein PilA
MMSEKNDKGFTLIELIIVIAIMAILVAMIAPNMTKYLAKSKQRTDQRNADEIASDLQICIADYESEYATTLIPPGPAARPLTVTWTAAGKYQSGIDEFDDIVNETITSSTESKEVKGHLASATIELNDAYVASKGYKITVTLGNAQAIK